MKNLKKMSFLFFIFFQFFAGCNKDTTKPNKEASEYFPNTVGDYWEYDVYDSSDIRNYPNYHGLYTVKISITGIKPLVDGKDATVWQYQYPWGTDINFIRIEGDTIKIYDTVYSKTIRNLEFPRSIFLIPFSDGQRWDGKLLAIDTSHVAFQSTIATSSGVFTNGFKIYHYYLGPNIEHNDLYYFVPKIGMVKIYYNHYDFAPTTQILWQLKKYYLK